MKGYLLLGVENKMRSLDSSLLAFCLTTLGIYSCKPLWKFETFLVKGLFLSNMSDRCASRQGYDI